NDPANPGRHGRAGGFGASGRRLPLDPRGQSCKAGRARERQPMFDIKWIRANPETFDAALGRRKGDYPKAAELIALDEQRRAVIVRLQAAQEQRNAASKLIGQAKAQKDEAKAQALLAEVAGLKETIQQGEAEERAVDAELRARLAELPNLPADDIPTGDDESANVEYFGRNGTPETAAAQRPSKPKFS